MCNGFGDKENDGGTFAGVVNIAESMERIENATNENTIASQDISATVQEETANLQEVSQNGNVGGIN